MPTSVICDQADGTQAEQGEAAGLGNARERKASQGHAATDGSDKRGGAGVQVDREQLRGVPPRRRHGRVGDAGEPRDVEADQVGGVDSQRPDGEELTGVRRGRTAAGPSPASPGCRGWSRYCKASSWLRRRNCWCRPRPRREASRPKLGSPMAKRQGRVSPGERASVRVEAQVLAVCRS